MADVIAWCLCAWLGAGTPKHGRSELCLPGVWAGPPAPYPAALQLPDPARDARIARRRAADRAAASRALDRLLGPPCTCVQASDTGHPPECPRADWARGNRY